MICLSCAAPSRAWGLARSPGLTKVGRPDIVGRRFKEKSHCSRMLLIVEMEMVWRRSETELGAGLGSQSWFNQSCEA